MTTHPLLGPIASVHALGVATLEAIKANSGCSIPTMLAEINARALEIASDPALSSLTLSGEQIKALALLAGFGVTVDDESMLEPEYVVSECPPQGVYNEGEPTDPNAFSYYSLVAWSLEYPEDGCVGLGPELPPPTGETP